MVVENHHDHVIVREPVLELQQTGHGRARRIPGEDALLTRDAAGHHGRILVGDLLEVIDDAEIHVLREEVLADALGDVGVDLVLVEDARLLVLLEHRPVGVDAPDLDLRVALLQEAADPGNGAAGSDAHDELRDAPVRLVPDFRSCLLVVRLQVREVVGTGSPSRSSAPPARAATTPSSTTAGRRGPRSWGTR